MMCIIMVILDYKKGRILSYLFMGISIVFMLIGIIARGEMSSLPGIYNAIITLISIVIISTGLAKADRRAVTDFLLSDVFLFGTLLQLLHDPLDAGNDENTVSIDSHSGEPAERSVDKKFLDVFVCEKLRHIFYLSFPGGRSPMTGFPPPFFCL